MIIRRDSPVQCSPRTLGDDDSMSKGRHENFPGDDARRLHVDGWT